LLPSDGSLLVVSFFTVSTFFSSVLSLAAVEDFFIRFFLLLLQVSGFSLLGLLPSDGSLLVVSFFTVSTFFSSVLSSAAVEDSFACRRFFALPIIAVRVDRFSI
jgi:hypothetical protein